MNLSETTLLLTRPEPAARRFRAEVEAALGAFGQVVISPLMRIVRLDVADGPAPEDQLVFTSENGVDALDAPATTGGRAWCVGTRTTARAKARGYDAVHAGNTGAALAERLLAERPQAALVHVAGWYRRDDLAGGLRAAGLDARTIVAYDQQAQPLTDRAREVLATPGDVMAPLFSPRSSRLLSRAAAGRHAHLLAVAISNSAAAEWHARPDEQLVVAPSPDARGMIDAMGRLFDADRSA